MSYSKESLKERLERYNRRLAHYISRLGGVCEVCGSEEGLDLSRRLDALRSSPRPSYALLHSDADDIREYLDYWYVICGTCKAEGKTLTTGKEVDGEPEWECVCGAQFYESGRYKSHCGNCKIRRRYKEAEDEDE